MDHQNELAQMIEESILRSVKITIEHINAISEDSFNKAPEFVQKFINQTKKECLDYLTSKEKV
jgi:replication fork clamp-binding protein CrfC